MSLLSVENPPGSHKYAFFHLGFRPLFLGGSALALISALLWFGYYSFGLKIIPTTVPPAWWHAHEMIFGYSLAIVGGFLLTAAKNWTGIQTLTGIPLFLLFLLWLLARLSFQFADADMLWTVALLDILFNSYLTAAIAYPIIKARQSNNFGLASKILLLTLSNIVFYLGATGVWNEGLRVGIYAGLYLILAVVLTLGRRVIPFFIENGVPEKVTLKNSKWVDISSLVLFFLFMISDIIYRTSMLTAGLALIQVPLHAFRLLGWYTPGIWKKPLLWILFVAYGFIIAGFLLKALSVFAGTPLQLAVHAFTYGGVAMITIGMMARVTLGHTGRNVFEPPKGLPLLFSLLIAGATARVILPLLMPSHYNLWVTAAFICWILAFANFLYLYAPMLIKARVDGRFG